MSTGIRQRRLNRFLFDEANQWLQSNDAQTVVEIGAIRDDQPRARSADGWSTLQWQGVEVHTIDSDPKALECTRRLVGHDARFHYYVSDGVTFLTNTNLHIDLLYLDGPDAERGGQQFSLDCFLCATLPDVCAILIDDCDEWPGRWNGRGKAELVLPAMREAGYKTIHDNGRQILSVRHRPLGDVVHRKVN